MKKLLFTTLLVASIFGLTAQVQTHFRQQPINSTSDAPRWHFIQHQQNGGVLELSENGSNVIYTKARLLSNANDRQLWRFERVGDNQFRIFNKARTGSFAVTSTSITWDETLTSSTAPIFTIGFGWMTKDKYTIKAPNRYFLHSTSQTDNLAPAASETASPYWVFIATAGGSTSDKPVWYQLQSERNNSITVLYDDNSTVKHKSTSDLTDDTQLWRLEEVNNNGYKIINKSSQQAMKFNGSLGVANNLGTSTTDFSTLVLSPSMGADSHLGMYLHGSSYSVLDFWADGRCGLFKKNVLGRNQLVVFNQQYDYDYQSYKDYIGEITAIKTASTTATPTSLETISAAIETANRDAKIVGTSSEIETSKQNIESAYQVFATPVLSPTNQTTKKENSITVTATANATVTEGTLYYTTDGTTPTTSSQSVASGETINITSATAKTITLKVIFIKDGLANSNVATGSYTFTSTTNVNDVTNTHLHEITVSNGIITVKGAENFELYSLSGQELNHQQRLNKGVYIVRIGNAVKKVIVK